MVGGDAQGDASVEIRFDSAADDGRVRPLCSKNDVNEHRATGLSCLLNTLLKLLRAGPACEHDLSEFVDEDDECREGFCSVAVASLYKLLLGGTRGTAALPRPLQDQVTSSRDLLLDEPFEDGVDLVVPKFDLGELR